MEKKEFEERCIKLHKKILPIVEGEESSVVEAACAEIVAIGLVNDFFNLGGEEMNRRLEEIRKSLISRVEQVIMRELLKRNKNRN